MIFKNLCASSSCCWIFDLSLTAFCSLNASLTRLIAYILHEKCNFIEMVTGQIRKTSFTCSYRMKTCHSPSTWSCRFWELRPWSLGLPSWPKTVQRETTVKTNRSWTIDTGTNDVWLPDTLLVLSVPTASSLLNYWN